MGESLIGRLKGVLAKKPATEAFVAAEPVDPPALNQPPTAMPEPAADRTASVQSTGPVVVPQDPLLPSPAPSALARWECTRNLFLVDRAIQSPPSSRR